MAEVRKVKPGRGGHIAEAVAKAMGEPVRPITPGAPPDPSQSSQTKPPPYSLTVTSFMTSDGFLIPASDDNNSLSETDERPDQKSERLLARSEGFEPPTF